jgi:bifunctional UDP-N-acetylglucosamine pyrophosphorylase/glucosamine-1-phosphate N-acetyltransferase
VYFSADTHIEPDVTIHPNVVFGPGVYIESGAEIRAFCHIEGALIKKGAVIGPFARLRPGTDIGEEAKIGNFVEIKNSKLAKGAKVNHLSYVGDTTVGERANIGAGTITCNYDGINKFKTEIGKDVLIGSNSSLIAPVKIGDGAVVGAGSAVSEDVAAGELSFTRSTQVHKPGWADKRPKKKHG